MDDSFNNDPCPCESGLSYSQCCGMPERNAINADILTKISTDNPLIQDQLTPQLRAALDNITTIPDFFPARINFSDDRAFFVKMSPRWYSESVFLDPARIKGTCVIESNLKWLQSAADQTAWHPSGLIFHTAFCGSTLMAQALDAVFNCLPLREPEVLGNVLFFIKSKTDESDIGEQTKLAWLERVMRLLSRQYKPLQRVVIKANDYANPLMIDLLNWRSDLPILFMYTPLDEFLAGCLKAENRRDWIRGRYKAIRNLETDIFHRGDIESLEDDAYGEMAAVYWAFNLALYYKARRLSTHSLRSLDFNAMLANPLESIQACGELFALQPLSGIDHEAQINKLFGVYSKNSKFKYSPQQRNIDVQKILESHPLERQSAERLARRLLQQDYPDDALPGYLLETPV